MAATARVKYILNTFDLTIGKMTQKIFSQSKVTSTNQKELRKSTSYVEGNEGVTVAATAPK
jgi:hypothetical protein